MKIFEQKNNQVIVSPEVLTIPEFSDIWKADKTKDKVEAYKAFTFIYHMVDFNSPCSNFPKDKKEDYIKESIIGNKNYKPSKETTKGLEIYKELQETPLQRLLQATKNKVDDIATYLESTDIDDENIKTIMDVFSKISSTIANFDKLQQAVEKETEKQTSRNRGDVIVNTDYNE